MIKRNRYHACATCINFVATKKDQGMLYYCKRLGYETKSDYVFNCWEPKPNVVKLINKNE
ncbi:hypothetical protein PY093_14570 [Cytobacillus sp. S13-E01]|uniref:hypothetical protein n=1 Tax=Cytobacillus sp. S13-E01 TaxID=3031326 RepID=UPI0023D8BE13|nr:hypothetical protein [Cytobacillus sp. S13-E01]MDF0727898.1 hypothetical protein [Cytobacillus sp. S13-E01]